MNTVAISYGATAVLPFGTIIVILLVWIAISIPFLALGGIIGYAYKSDFQAPCATRRLPLEIPIMDWYRKTPAQMFLGGLLPFSAIFIELHYINISLWGHKIYTVDYILFVVFILLIIITAILNIGLTYLQLSVEDHLWWWRSVLSGSATAIFMHAYCIYFYFRSDMSGFMQLFLFRLQCLHLLCLLYDAWHYRFPCFLSVCSSYIPQCQVGMILQACLVSSIMA